MSSKEWNSYTLNDILQIPLRNGVNKPSKVRGAGYKMVNMGELFANPIIQGIDMERVPLSDSELVNCLLQEGDLLFARQSLTVEGAGKCSLFLGDDELTTFEGHLIRARPDRELALPRYLYYYFQSHHGTSQIKSIVTVTAAAGIRSSDLGNLEIPLPPIEIQRRIADILSALDDKIELNRQTNATLEAMAQAIFKEWFVDFNYPDATGELVDSELGLIPAGWRVGKLGEVANIKHGFAFKGEYFSEEETDDILLTPGNFRIGGGFNYSKFKYYEGTYPQEYVLKHGDLIVTMTDLSKQGDTLGFSALVPAISDKNLLHNQRIGKVEVTESNSWKLYLYWVMQQRDYRNYVLSGATGTTVKHTSPSRICDYKIILPPLKVLQAFKSTVRGLIDLVEDNHLQANTLEKVRDTLLPKLIRGEIEV